MKLIESERARAVSFSKRKKTLFEDAKKFATQTGADVAVMLFSPGGKPYSCGSTSVEDIIENFLKMKVADPRRHYAEEIPQDKHMEEQKLALKLRVGNIKKETLNSILKEHMKFDLNVALDPEDEEEY
ncbi:agamous-like MADS-box protein AGL29 [Solanum lycopersicum]|uniref:agamous-like MADS-box protein AGL29 n=1 Tax=Solanum lycopersicum TaxID=4081 RepID=UPI0037484EB7